MIVSSEFPADPVRQDIFKEFVSRYRKVEGTRSNLKGYLESFFFRWHFDNEGTCFIFWRKDKDINVYHSAVVVLRNHGYVAADCYPHMIDDSDLNNQSRFQYSPIDFNELESVHDFAGVHPELHLVRIDGEVDVDAAIANATDAGLGLKATIGNCLYFETAEDVMLFKLKFT